MFAARNSTVRRCVATTMLRLKLLCATTPVHWRIKYPEKSTTKIMMTVNVFVMIIDSSLSKACLYKTESLGDLSTLGTVILDQMMGRGDLNTLPAGYETVVPVKKDGAEGLTKASYHALV